MQALGAAKKSHLLSVRRAAPPPASSRAVSTKAHPSNTAAVPDVGTALLPHINRVTGTDPGLHPLHSGDNDKLSVIVISKRQHCS